MKDLVDRLSQYAAYHKNTSNIVCHFIGVPLITVAVTALLSRPNVSVGAAYISPAVIASAILMLYYLKLDFWLGFAMVCLLSASDFAGFFLASASTIVWLESTIFLFVLGWAMQLVGHVFERRKPAFIDDLAGLAIGPIFLIAELCFVFGLRKSLKQAFRGGPVRSDSFFDF